MKQYVCEEAWGIIKAQDIEHAHILSVKITFETLQKCFFSADCRIGNFLFIGKLNSFCYQKFMV